jgi:hypothetical protein
VGEPELSCHEFKNMKRQKRTSQNNVVQQLEPTDHSGITVRGFLNEKVWPDQFVPAWY